MKHSDFFYLWPCFVKPKKDELLSSWLYRIAHNHHLKAHTFVRLVFENGNIWNRDIDGYAPKNVLELLATRTGCTLEQVRSTQLGSLEGLLLQKFNPFGNNSWILPLGIYHRKRKRFGQMFCPECLGLGIPYYRKTWRISLFTSCVNCGIHLHDRCPKCGHPVCFFRQDVGYKEFLENSKISYCYHCNFDLRLANKSEVNHDYLKWQKRLYNGIRTGYLSKWNYSFQYFDVLRVIIRNLNSKSKYAVPLQITMDEMIGKSYVERPGGYQNQFNFQSIENRQQSLYQGMLLLKDWPKSFTRICSENNIQGHIWTRDFSQVPYWFLQVIESNFLRPIV